MKLSDKCIEIRGEDAGAEAGKDKRKRAIQNPEIMSITSQHQISCTIRAPKGHLLDKIERMPVPNHSSVLYARAPYSAVSIVAWPGSRNSPIMSMTIGFDPCNQLIQRSAESKVLYSALAQASKHYSGKT